ncbi:MAG: SDR family NAD(P)-dependent oxidoreductase, partial [Corynebacterium variabile]|nr:SDR family NAD(P)-dependent oxidoreductase [Corynebacterium variabile]
MQCVGQRGEFRDGGGLGQCVLESAVVGGSGGVEQVPSLVGVDSLDILVSNAGIAIGGRITETKTDTWQKALDINVLGSVRGLRVFVPKIGKGGRIVLTASAAGLVHAPAMATYNATKAATVALGETVDAELRHRKISTPVICPQFFKSGLADSLTGD